MVTYDIAITPVDRGLTHTKISLNSNCQSISNLALLVHNVCKRIKRLLTYIHNLTPFSHGGRQKPQNATYYDPYILLSPRSHSYIWSYFFLTSFWEIIKGSSSAQGVRLLLTKTTPVFLHCLMCRSPENHLQATVTGPGLGANYCTIQNVEQKRIYFIAH